MSAKKQAKPGRPPRSKYIHFRFPQPLIDKLDQFARDETTRTGYHVNRTQALRKLVELGLEAGRSAPAGSKSKTMPSTPRPAPEAPKKPPPEPQPSPRTTFRFDEVDGFKATPPPTGTTDKRRKRFYCTTCKARTRGVETCSECGTRRSP